MIRFDEYNTRKKVFESGYGSTFKGADSVKEFNEHLLESESTDEMNEYGGLVGPRGSFGTNPEADKAFKSFGIGMCGFLFFGPSVILLGAIAGSVGVVALVKKIAQKRKRKKLHSQIDTAADNYKKAYIETLNGRLALNALKRKKSDDSIGDNEKEDIEAEYDKLKIKQEGLEKKPKSIEGEIMSVITSTAKDGGQGDPELISYKNQKFTAAEVAALEEAASGKDVDEESVNALKEAKKVKEEQFNEYKKQTNNCEEYVPEGFEIEASDEEYVKIKENCGDKFNALYEDGGTKKIKDAEGNDVEEKDENGKPIHILKYKYDDNQEGIDKYASDENLGEGFSVCETGQADEMRQNKNKYDTYPWYNDLVIFKIAEDAQEDVFNSEIATLAGKINEIVADIKKSVDGEKPMIDAKHVGNYIMSVEMLKSIAGSNPDKEKAKANVESFKGCSIFFDDDSVDHINDKNVSAILIACAMSLSNEKDKYIDSVKGVCVESLKAIKSNTKDAKEYADKLSKQIKPVFEACKNINIKNAIETVKSLEIEIKDDGTIKGSANTSATSEDVEKAKEAINACKTQITKLIDKNGGISEANLNNALKALVIACKQIIDNKKKFTQSYRKIEEFYEVLTKNIEKCPTFDDYVKSVYENIPESENITYLEELNEANGNIKFKNDIRKDCIELLKKSLEPEGTFTKAFKSVEKSAAKDPKKAKELVKNIKAANKILNHDSKDKNKKDEKTTKSELVSVINNNFAKSGKITKKSFKALCKQIVPLVKNEKESSELMKELEKIYNNLGYKKLAFEKYINDIKNQNENVNSSATYLDIDESSSETVKFNAEEIISKLPSDAQSKILKNIKEKDAEEKKNAKIDDEVLQILITIAGAKDCDQFRDLVRTDSARSALYSLKDNENKEMKKNIKLLFKTLKLHYKGEPMYESSNYTYEEYLYESELMNEALQFGLKKLGDAIKNTNAYKNAEKVTSFIGKNVENAIDRAKDAKDKVVDATGKAIDKVVNTAGKAVDKVKYIDNLINIKIDANLSAIGNDVNYDADLKDETVCKNALKYLGKIIKIAATAAK